MHPCSGAMLNDHYSRCIPETRRDSPLARTTGGHFYFRGFNTFLMGSNTKQSLVGWWSTCWLAYHTLFTKVRFVSQTNCSVRCSTANKGTFSRVEWWSPESKSVHVVTWSFGLVESLSLRKFYLPIGHRFCAGSTRFTFLFCLGCSAYGTVHSPLASHHWQIRARASKTGYKKLSPAPEVEV